jgi:hypothetical protein
MKTYALLFVLLFVGCKSADSYRYETKQNKYSTTYNFKNSKSVVFNDSITNQWFIGNSNKIPFVPNVIEIIALNKKLEKHYATHVIEKQQMYNVLLPEKYSKIENKETTKYAKGIQSKMRKLNKQFVGYIDSLGQKIIAVKIITDKENKMDFENYWVGNIINVQYDLNTSKFVN